MDPTCVTPEKHNEALLLEALLHFSRHFPADVFLFFERMVKHGNFLKCTDPRINLGQAAHGERGRLKLTDAHALDRVTFAAHGAAPVNGEGDTAVGGASPILAHLFESLILRGALRQKGAKTNACLGDC